MTILNYSDLQISIADWLHRTDLAQRIPDFIFLAEKKIANNIKARQQEVAITLTTTAGVPSVTLPSDYGSLKNIQVSGAFNTPLTYISDETYLNYNADNSSGIPRFFTIQGDQVLLSPVPNAEFNINIVYFQDLTPLSSTNPTNWILNKYPMIYLYGALIEAAIFTNDPDQVSFYQSTFNNALSDIWANSMYESFSGSVLNSVSDYIA